MRVRDSLGVVALSAVLALPSCSTREGGGDDDESCRCQGNLPEGGRIDVECGSSACIAGVGYLCDAEDHAVVDPDACSPEGGADAGQEEAEPDAGADAAVPADVCHSGYYTCDDGIACCGDLACDYGTCRVPEGNCTPLGSDCSANPCCPPFTCRDYQFGSRCAHPDSCAAVGDACADTGGCCGGLQCESGVCRARPQESGSVAYGEYCWDGEDCGSMFTCDAELCCIPPDWTNDTCRNDGECCTGVCVGGICDCAPIGDACNGYYDCCNYDYGPICMDGLCCLDVDAACDRDGDCCTGQCDGGTCTCLPAGAASSSSGLCCNMVAVNGRCG